ncbi:MAG: helix-turn-helix transcriptional regulator [Bacilli bacterium]|nr:helix-turn-helix transcriptional regulator [Bacilli bacterium]
MKIGEKIYSLRKKYNLSQEELANELNVSRQTVSKWEVGESCPDFDKIVPLCELFGISTEELLRDKKIEEKEETPTEKKVDVVKAVLICISIFIYFLAIISVIVLDDVANVNEGISAASFLTLNGIATVILVFTLMTRKNKTEKKVEEIKLKKENTLQKSVISIAGLIATITYLLVSFLTMAWHITWIIWLVYAVVIEIIKLIFSLKGKEENEE